MKFPNSHFKSPALNGPPVTAKARGPLVAIKNREDGTKPVEILIYDEIGKSEWTGEGFDAKDFAAAIKGIDDNRELHVRVNSRGGVVDDGIAIYNRLREWKGRTVAIVDGGAASIASVIIMGAKEVRMPKSAEILIHEAHGLAFGHADDMREMVTRLDGASDRIAGIYATKTGKGKDEFRRYMKATTVFNGEEAKRIGLADVLTDETPLYNFTPEVIDTFRPVPDLQKKTTGTPPTPPTAPVMNRTQLIALLNQWTIKFDDQATDAELVALLENHKPSAPAAQPAKADPAPDLAAAITAALAPVTAQLEAAKKEKITNAVNQLVENNQLTTAEAPKAIERALKDESYLTELRARPAVMPGAEPVSGHVEVIGNSPREIEQGILKNWGGKTILDPMQAAERGRVRAAIINRHLDKLLPVLNTNTVSSDLKRTVILQQAIRAFAIKVLQLSAFSTRLAGFRLEGTDKVAVPYFSLNTTASTAFVAANGYDTVANSNSDAKTVTLDKRQYQQLRWTSSELARQPFMDMMTGIQLLAEQLGLDVVNDVLSIVTLANFGAAAKVEAAAAFDSDDVIDLKGAADTANWPASGRSLMLNSAYDVNLLKDQSVKDASAFGDNSPIREGRIFRLSGFDYYGDARVPGNSQNLQGFINWKSAILVAFAPIDPTPEVRQQLSRYEVVTEPTTGATFEYRLWGNPDLDQTREIVEVNYGKSVGEAGALKRITSA